MNETRNPGIRCTVEQCRYNLCSENACCLGTVRIGTHETDPSVKECVDCDSFEKRSSCE